MLSSACLPSPTMFPLLPSALSHHLAGASHKSTDNLSLTKPAINGRPIGVFFIVEVIKTPDLVPFRHQQHNGISNMDKGEASMQVYIVRHVDSSDDILLISINDISIAICLCLRCCSRCCSLFCLRKRRTVGGQILLTTRRC